MLTDGIFGIKETVFDISPKCVYIVSTLRLKNLTASVDITITAKLAGKNLNFTPPVWSEYFSVKDLTGLLSKINKDFYCDAKYIIRFLSEFKNYYSPLRKIRAFLSI